MESKWKAHESVQVNVKNTKNTKIPRTSDVVLWRNDRAGRNFRRKCLKLQLYMLQRLETERNIPAESYIFIVQVVDRKLEKKCVQKQKKYKCVC